MKYITVGKILAIIVNGIVVLLFFAMDINLLWIQQLSMAALMFLLAYEHILQKKERDVTFWGCVLGGVFCFVVAIIMVQPFF